MTGAFIVIDEEITGSNHAMKCLMRIVEQRVEPRLNTALRPDRPLQQNHFFLTAHNREDFVVVLVVELHQRRVVEDG